jgi:hypothetical protein
MYTSVPETNVSRHCVNKGLITSLADLEMKSAFQFGVHTAYIFGNTFSIGILNASLAFFT